MDSSYSQTWTTSAPFPHLGEVRIFGERLRLGRHDVRTLPLLLQSVSAGGAVLSARVALLHTAVAKLHQPQRRHGANGVPLLQVPSRVERGGVHSAPVVVRVAFARARREAVNVHRSTRHERGDQPLEAQGELEVKGLGEIPREVDVESVETNLWPRGGGEEGTRPTGSGGGGAPRLALARRALEPFVLAIERGDELLERLRRPHDLNHRLLVAFAKVEVQRVAHPVRRLAPRRVR